MILVVLCGLALGGLLTKFFGAGAVKAPTPVPSFTPLPEATATFAAAPSVLTVYVAFAVAQTGARKNGIAATVGHVYSRHNTGS